MEFHFGPRLPLVDGLQIDSSLVDLPVSNASTRMVKRTGRPAMQVGVKDVIGFSRASFSPTRLSDLAVGNLPGSSNGLHGSRRGNERSRAFLLSRHEQSVRTAGDAGIAWLLPEGSAEPS